MPILATAVLFVLLVIVVSLVGMRYYVRPNEALERIAGGGVESAEESPKHPSLAFHDIIRRLGSIVPASPKDVTVMQRRLIRAGFRGPNALKILYGAKVSFGVVVPLITAALVAN